MKQKILLSLLSLTLCLSLAACSQPAANNGAAQPAETNQAQAESPKPAENAKPSESVKPAESSKPVESPKPAETSKPAESAAPALARALVLDPDVLLLDEPFSAMDPVTKQVMYEQIRSIREKFSCAILFVAHDFAEAQFLADRIGIMSEGRLLAVRSRETRVTPSGEKKLDELLGIQSPEGGTVL